MKRVADFPVGAPIAHLGHEAVIRAKAVAEVLLVAAPVDGRRGVQPGDFRAVTGEHSPIPLGCELRSDRGLRYAVEPLPGNGVAVVGAPLEIRSEDAVGATALHLAPREEEAKERPGDVAPKASYRHQGAEVLVSEAGGVGSGQDNTPPSPILREKAGECGGPELPRGPQAPAGRGDRACVNRLDGRAEELGSLQKEGALFRIEEGEPFIGGDLGHVRLYLGKIGIYGGVDGGAGARRPLCVKADFPIDRAALEGGPRHPTPGSIGLACARIGGENDMATRGKAGQAIELALVADEAGGAAG